MTTRLRHHRVDRIPILHFQLQIKKYDVRSTNVPILPRYLLGCLIRSNSRSVE